jgi:ketosteroid isomerase-like protein
MFHAIAERKVRQIFEGLSDGRYEPAMEALAPRFEHIFAGDHAWGGARHTVDGLRAWFQRLYRLFPNLNFEISAIAVSGPPWATVVVVEWIDRATPAGGGTYENHGAGESSSASMPISIRKSWRRRFVSWRRRASRRQSLRRSSTLRDGVDGSSCVSRGVASS